MAAGNRSNEVARTGLLPQAGFGVAVSGLSDADLDSMRRLQEAGTGGRRRGRNMARQRLVDGDLAATMALEPILEWAKEVQATHRREPGACTLGELVAFWKTATAKGIKRWADTRGPVGFAWLTFEMDLGRPLDIDQCAGPGHRPPSGLWQASSMASQGKPAATTGSAGQQKHGCQGLDRHRPRPEQCHHQAGAGQQQAQQQLQGYR